MTKEFTEEWREGWNERIAKFQKYHLHLHPRVRALLRVLLEHFDEREEFVGAEVGVERGYTSRPLLEHFRNLHLHLLDAWTAGISSTEGEQILHDNNLIETLHNVRPYRERTTIHWRESSAGDAIFADESLDFVYLDANHYYEGCRDDVTVWYPKVKPGGLFIGDDYNGRMDKHGIWGVKRAVDECIPKLDKNAVINTDRGNLFWVQKS